MATILDYLYWRGDIPFSAVPFCDVDRLILCRMAYLPFDGLLDGEDIPISEAANRHGEMGKENGGRILLENDRLLFDNLAKSRRFGGLVLSDYVNILVPAEEKQFSAVTITLEDGSRYLAFRGTDSTLVGWKEDFNMTFMHQVPSQREAVAYTVRAAQASNAPLRLGGHSKGGNLAVYAGAFSPEEIQERILEVSNLDGPGFDGALLTELGYGRIRDRVHTWVPQSSIIGMLLEHEEDYTVVYSTQKGLQQHDVYSWQVTPSGFMELETVTESSRFIDHTIKDWLSKVEPDQRERFLDAMYEIFCATGAQTLNELSSAWLKNSGAMLKRFGSVDVQTKSFIWHTMCQLVSAAKNNMPRPKLPLAALRRGVDEARMEE